MLPAAVGLSPISDTGYALKLSRNYSGLEHAGYTFLSDVWPGKLAVSRFGAAPIFGKSQVSLLDLETGSLADLATGIDWPNVITPVNASVFGFDAMLVGAGFLVPSHTLGGVWLIEASTTPKTLPKPIKITKDQSTSRFLPDSGYFYHKATLLDMNGDGRLDVVTSKCADSVEPFNPKVGKLVWLEQPAGASAWSGEPWKEHAIADGPDFLFTVAPSTLSGDEVRSTRVALPRSTRVALPGRRAGGGVRRAVGGATGSTAPRARGWLLIGGQGWAAHGGTGCQLGAPTRDRRLWRPQLGVCAAEYLGERLTYTSGSERTGYRTRVVDDALGPGFGCTFVDLNGDGKVSARPHGSRSAPVALCHRPEPVCSPQRLL